MHLDRRSSAADERKRLSAQIESDLEADNAETQRRLQRKQHKQEQQR